MKRSLSILLLVFAFAFPAFATTYYASITGSGTTCSLASPCTLTYALSSSSPVGAGHTLYLRGGTYLGKFQSDLTGGTVRSYPGEWAVIDGYFTTTLNGAINSSQTSGIALADASNVLVAGVNEIWVDNEVITAFAKSGNTITSASRNAEGTTGGAASHSDGATVRLVANYQLVVNGSNTTYRDFEVRSSLPNRTVIYQKMRGLGIHNIGDGNSYINLIIHDNITGFLSGSSSSDTLLYGNLVYNNGMETMAPYGDPPNYPRGGNLYLENESGYSRVYENLLLNGFTFNGQFFGVTGPYVGGDVKGSVFAHAGSAVLSYVPDYFPNAYIGTGSQEIPYASVDESYFWMPASAATGNFTMGYNAGMAVGDVTDSYFIGANTGVSFLPTIGTFTGNKVDVNQAGSHRHLISPGTSNTINNNTYYHTAEFYYGPPGDTSKTFTEWKAVSGYDSSSTEVLANIPDTVIVRPNAYQTGRANIVILAAFSSPTSINVNLSTTGLTHGQSYTIKNAFNYFGSSVATGTYNSSSPTVSVPLNGAAATVATPTGMSTTPATTCPQLCVLIVEPQTITNRSVKVTSGVRLTGARIQ